MKLVSFRAGDRTSFGVVSGSSPEGMGVVDAGRRLQIADLKAALEAGPLDRLGALASETPDHRLDQLELLPVIPNPGKIFCIGINYASHVKEMGREMPNRPMIFTRFPESQVGHLQPMLRPPESEQFDFEGELAVVIGKGGRRIKRDEALEHVAGYACYNDGSIRDWQRHTAQFTPGKNFERTGGFGPWLVTADEIPDPSQLTLETRLNDQVMQQTPTSDMIFDVPALIEYLSTFIRLSPGDVIVSGTTGGVGAARNPPVWMRDGDTVEIEISRIGVLKNTIADETLGG